MDRVRLVTTRDDVRAAADATRHYCGQAVYWATDRLTRSAQRSPEVAAEVNVLLGLLRDLDELAAAIEHRIRALQRRLDEESSPQFNAGN